MLDVYLDFLIAGKKPSSSDLKKVKSLIYDFWNDKFKLDCQCYELTGVTASQQCEDFEIEFHTSWETEPKPGNNLVRFGTFDRYNSSRWPLPTSAHNERVIVHEFAHRFGAYDEYAKVYKKNEAGEYEVIYDHADDEESIMSYGDEPRARHLSEISASVEEVGQGINCDIIAK